MSPVATAKLRPMPPPSASPLARIRRPRTAGVLVAMTLAVTMALGTSASPARAEDEVAVQEPVLSELEPADLGSQGPMIDPVPEGLAPIPYKFQDPDQQSGPQNRQQSRSSSANGNELNLEQSQLVYGCEGYGTLPRYNPIGEVARDRYAFDIFPRVSVGNGKGNINWTLDPYGDLGWKLWFSSLRWLGTTIEAARGGDIAAMDKATTIIRDWEADHGTDWSQDINHMEANTHRLNVLLCYREVVMQLNDGIVPNSFGWLSRLMDLHARHNVGQWSGINNHGSMENRALLGYGCIVGNTSHQRHALDRIHRAFPHQLDTEGLSNEAAPHYAAFNYALFSSMSRIMQQCGHSSSLFDQRLTLMGVSLAHMTDSTGYYWEYGNSNVYRARGQQHPAATYAATNGREGQAPKERIKAYAAGPVFGRSSWGDPTTGFANETAWTLRGGTGREHKAHRGDLMQFLYTTRGRKIFVDGGFAGVTKDKWGSWDDSEVAHNVIHVSTLPEHSFGPTRLARSQWSADGRSDFTEMVQEYGSKGSKTRGTLVMTGPDVSVVLDRTRINDGRTHVVQSLWNIPPGQTTNVSGRSYVISDVDGASSTRLVMVHVPFWGNPEVQRGETYRLRGAQGATQRGFYFERTFQPTPIDQIGFSRVGTNVGTISVIVPTRKTAKVGVQKSKYADGATKLRISIGADVVTVRITAGGYMSRVG